jgi:hypothetical protein
VKLKLAREIAAASLRSRARSGKVVPFTEEQLAVMRGGLTAEEYRAYIIRKFGK